MKKGTNLLSRASEYTRSYRDIRGVELNGSGTDISTGRLAYSENMYRDYEGDGPGAVESIPGFRKLYSFGQRINGIYLHKMPGDTDYIIVHSGYYIFRLKLSEIDSLNTLSPIATVSSEKSSGFAFGDDFFLLDGVNIFRIDKNGFACRVGIEIGAYIPTLYINSAVYEQRNLLTDSFKEIYKIENPKFYAHSTGGLKYSITDPDNLLCAVSGVESHVSGHIDIPGFVTLGDLTYSVTEIGNNAFAYNKNITSVKISEGIERICDLAFYYCTSLKSACLPSTVREIGNASFASCTTMTEIYLGRGLSKFGASTFSTCVNLTNVYYGADADRFSRIENNSVLGARTILYGITDPSFNVSFPCHSEVKSVSMVTVNGIAKAFTELITDGKVTGILMRVEGTWELSGAQVIILGTLLPFTSNFRGELTVPSEGEINGAEAIYGCTIAEAFDGRIFITGNPRLPNTVFYTSRDNTGANNPLYIGVYNYFNDGIGKYPVISMLAVRDSLAVFKSGDDGCGSIFYHTAKETGNDLLPKIYPASYVHSGLCASGKAISFLDDPVFISKTGLSALTMKAINYERSIACRSHNVNYDLLKEDLSQTSLTEWLGYLVVGSHGRAYLADSRATFTHRTGNEEYEWFVLTNIGTYQNATRVYRYSQAARSGYDTYLFPDTACEGTVMSEMTGGDVVYYCVEDGKKYELYPTEEMQGGSFSPAVTFFGCGELLFFGTQCGDLAVFNNDKRGVAPDSLKSDPNFNPEEYKSTMGRRIHPVFYSFDNHAVTYAIKTVADDCGIPHLTKSTSKNSLCIKMKGYNSTDMTVEIGTDKSGYSELAKFPGGELNFGELDFGKMCMISEDYYTIPIGEKEKDWVEKQIALYSRSFRAPIGIYSITYRYRIRGRIKNK